MKRMNISGTTAMDPRWHNQLLETISASKLAENRLIVEITETVAINDLVSTRRFVERLREAGCGVAIDDFGAGFTSFKNLRELPITMVKIDGSYCRNLAANKENAFIVRNLIELGRNFNLTTVAEWIETEEDAKLLQSWGVDYLQGHHIAAASIDPPWEKTTAVTFNLATNEQVTADEKPEIQPAVEITAAPAPVFQTRQSQSDEQPIWPQDKVAPEGDLEFSDIEASIATLKATMAQFSGNTSQPKPENEENRSAA